MTPTLRMIVDFLLRGVSVLVVAWVLPGMKVKSYGDALGFALVVAFLNFIAWKVFGILTWPMTIVTLGIVGFILNGFIFLIAQKIVKGVEISGCFVASLAAVLVSIAHTVIGWVLMP